MKYSLLLLLISAWQVGIAQKKPPTEQEARDYFDKNKEITSSFTYYEDDGEIFKIYSLKKPGDIIINGQDLHKVIGSSQEVIYNCSMIFFDNRKQPEAEIESAQKTILANYESGFTFQELAERYSDPVHFTNEAEINTEDMPDCPLKSGLEQHKPKEMFLVKASEYISYLIILNDFPAKRNSVKVQHAVYE
ncbi:hypothetical protein [Flavobacterium suzhouense]|uniref:Uncharacterized protein n=1 Tax=Flavobacterium suzhouense TaxID=1529638 RepID=A0ABW5NTZ9_9FLAO